MGGRYWEDSHDHDPRRFRPAYDATSAAIDARPAAAITFRPWCVQYSGGSGNNGLTCAFSSYEQCMMTGGPGTGGSCVQNPWYLWLRASARDVSPTIAVGPGGSKASPVKRRQ